MFTRDLLPAVKLELVRGGQISRRGGGRLYQKAAPIWLP